MSHARLAQPRLWAGPQVHDAPIRTPFRTLRSGMGLVAIISMLLQLCSSLAPPPVSGARALSGAASVAGSAAAQLSAAEQGQIEALMREAEYQATPRARADGKAAFWAPNRGNDLSLSFGPAGLDVTPLSGNEAWSLSLRAMAYGPEGAPQALAAPPALEADRQRVEYRWPGVSEWYLNNAQGLKHNITLEQPVAANQLQVDLALGGTLRPQIGQDGQAISFVDAAGATRLAFGPLYVYDAAGRTLEAHFGTPRGGGAVLPIVVEAAGAQFPITIDPLLTSPRSKITASPIQGGAQFGFATAVDGDVLVAGAFFEDGFRTPNKGAAYVFTRNQGGADSWGNVRKLAANDGRVDDNFGASVDVAGDVVVVGAPRADALAVNDGAAYVFERHLGGPDNWSLKKKLVPSRADAGDEFGFAVTVSGDAIAVGAPNDDTRAADAGAIYFFGRFTGPELNWGEVQQLSFADHAGARLGFALGMDGRTLVAGAPLTDATAVDSGRVFVFKRDRSVAGRWQQEAFFSGSDSAAGDNFGRTVAIDGDSIAAGAPLHDASGAIDRGAAYLFSRNQGGLERWGQTKKLLLNGGAAGDRFGESVAVDGAVVVAGAPRDDDELGGRADAGSIAVFVDGQQLVKLMAADRQADDRFGFGVAVSGDLVVAGAPLSNASATDAGAAYLFTLASEQWNQVRHITSDEVGNSLALAVSGDTLVVGAEDDDVVVVFQRNAGGVNRWSQVRTLTDPAADGSAHQFGTEVALDGDTLVVSAVSNRISSPPTGRVYIFERNRGGDNNWGLVGEALPATTHPSFGEAVAINGDTVVVGAPSAARNGLGNAGQVEVFMRNQGGTNRWGRTAVLSIGAAGLVPAGGDRFGDDIAIDGNTLVVGTGTLFPDEQYNADTVHIFARDVNGTSWSFQKHLRLLGPREGGSSHTLDLENDTLVVGLPHMAGESTSGPGVVIVYNRNRGGSNTWGEVKRIAAPTEALNFGSEVALVGDTLAVGAPSSSVRAKSGGAVYLVERNVGGADNWGLVTTVVGSQVLEGHGFGGFLAFDDSTLVAGTGAPDHSTYVFTNAIRAPTGFGLRRRPTRSSSASRSPSPRRSAA